MGARIEDYSTMEVVCKLNMRFAAGQPIKEIAALHKEFNIFSPDHTLEKSFEVLGIVPADRGDMAGWRLFLRSLRCYKSNVAGRNGHDAIRLAFKENLERDEPLPMCIATHASKDDPRILVNLSQPFDYIPVRHVEVDPMAGTTGLVS